MKNKHLNNVSDLEKSGYKGLKVTSILKACLSVEIKQHLRLVQIDELSRINNKHFKQGYISKAEMTLVWNIFWNFVLNDFRFDSDIELTKVSASKVCSEKHIGIIKLEELKSQANA